MLLKKIFSAQGVESEDSFSNVSLLLHGEGTNGSTTITDSSSFANTMTAVGGASISTTQRRFGLSSIYFDGASDRVTTPLVPSLDLLVFNKWTFEAWVYPTRATTTGSRIFSSGGGSVTWNSTNGIHILIQTGGGTSSGGVLDVQISSGTSTPIGASSSEVVPVDKWSHIAVSVDGLTGYLSVNGVVTSFSLAGKSRPSTDPLLSFGMIPGEGSSSSNWFGYMDEVRISKNISRYQTSFSIPTQPFPDASGGSFSSVSALLHANGTNGSTLITDSSSFAHTFTAFGNAAISTVQSRFGGASLYLDGTGDYVSAVSSSSFDFGTQDFTLEAWIRYDGGATFPVIIGRQEANLNMALQFRLNGSALELVLRSPGGADLLVISGGSISTNTWTHVAASRLANTARIFVNGVTVGSNTSSHNLTASRPLTVGVVDYTVLDGFFKGYIDEVRVTKGIARYIDNFNTPTAPFPDN